jgi:hypothetical protein
MNATALATLVARAGRLCEQSRYLRGESAGLKADALRLCCEISEIHEDITWTITVQDTASRRVRSRLPGDLLAMPPFDAAHAANLLVDEAGGRARVIAIERLLACKMRGDKAGAANWTRAFDAVMAIQHTAWRAAARRANAGADGDAGAFDLS